MNNTPVDTRGTLTPPTSSPLGNEFEGYTKNSSLYPNSPDVPLTPDSAHHMSLDSGTNSRKDSRSDSYQNANSEGLPLTGARKRKATPAFKLETGCVSGNDEMSSTSHLRLTCNVCHSVMITQHDFTRHIRIHNRVIEDDSSGAKLFECGLCQKQLSSNSSLDRHMLVHSGERPFRCHICGTHFTTNGNMHRHIRGHYRNGGNGDGSDSAESDVGSDGGSANFPRKRKLELEDESSSNKLPRLQSGSYSADDEFSIHVEEEIICPICNQELSGSSALENHLETNHSDQNITIKASLPKRDSPVKELFDFTIKPSNIFPKDKNLSHIFPTAHYCHTCNIPFPSIETWLLHLRNHPSLKCSLCDKTSDSVTDYIIHQQSHSQNSFLRFMNSKLNPELDFSPHSLLKHLTQSSYSIPLESPNFQTSVYPSSLPKPNPLHLFQRRPPPQISSSINSSSSNSALSHEEQFLRDYKEMKLNGQYPCRLCKEVFANLRKLKSHNLIHMVSPPYQCNLCSYVSNDKNTLKEHMKNHKGDTPYECNLCTLSFTTKANCERHIRNIHGRLTREEIKRCMVYIPQNDSNLEASQDTVCHFCNFDCKSKSVLKDHMRTSHFEGIEKPYSCKICRLTFQSSNDVCRHIIQAHQNIAASEKLETLVEEKSFKKEIHQDLSPVESLLNFSKIPLPIANCKDANERSQSSASTLPPLIKSQSHHPIQPSSQLIPQISFDTYSPPKIQEDSPLDLSTKKHVESKPVIKSEENSDEEIVVIDKEDKKDNTKVSDAKAINLEVNHNLLTREKQSFPIIYPNQLPMHLMNFQRQYPFFINPFNPLQPVPNLHFLEQYKADLKRELNLTSGGSLLNQDHSFKTTIGNTLLTNNRIFNSGISTLHFPTLTPKSAETKYFEPKQSGYSNQTQFHPTDLSVSKSKDEFHNFTVSHSILMKKPKQRRYRTERPWRCDLCDKGFTLRSNMDRHMKQQHPDTWQQRPKIPIGPLDYSQNKESGSYSNSDSSEALNNEDSDANEITKEDDEKELIIDDDDEDTEMDEFDDKYEEENEDYFESEYQENTEYTKEEQPNDLASVQKLLSTAASNSFDFFHKSSPEICNKNENSPCLSPLSQGEGHSSEEGRKSAYSSAPQRQKCPFCHRKFPWSSSLVRHIRTHTGQKPYLCPVCNFPFTTKSNCDRHLQRKHPNSSYTLLGDRPFRCNQCPGTSFVSLESLKKHETFRHGRKESLPRPAKIFGCFVCELRFNSPTDTVHHIAKEHSENFKSLRIGENRNDETLNSAPTMVSSCPVVVKPNSQPHSSKNCENVIEIPSHSKESIFCVFCYQTMGSISQLKEHTNIYHSSATSNSTDSLFRTSLSINVDSIKIDGSTKAGAEDLQTLHQTTDQLEIAKPKFNAIMDTENPVLNHVLNSNNNMDNKLLDVR